MCVVVVMRECAFKGGGREWMGPGLNGWVQARQGDGEFGIEMEGEVSKYGGADEIDPQREGGRRGGWGTEGR